MSDIEQDAENCFRRIQREARKNLQPVPFQYWIEEDEMFCEIPLHNPSIFAEKKDDKWIAFFEM